MTCLLETFTEHYLQSRDTNHGYQHCQTQKYSLPPEKSTEITIFSVTEINAEHTYAYQPKLNRMFIFN